MLVNNADRKGGHILLDESGHIWLIDHGVCFHQEDKLRTVVWDFAGEPIPALLLEAVGRFRQALTGDAVLQDDFALLLAAEEIEALTARGNLDPRDRGLPSARRGPAVSLAPGLAGSKNEPGHFRPPPLPPPRSTMI